MCKNFSQCTFIWSHDDPDDPTHVEHFPEKYDYIINILLIEFIFNGYITHDTPTQSQ